MPISKTTMEESLKQSKFPSRRVHDTGLLGCFIVPRHKRHAPGSPDSSTSSKEDFFSSDDADAELFPRSRSTSKEELKVKLSTKCAKSLTGSRLLSNSVKAPLLNDDDEAAEDSFAFSPPVLPDDVLESPSFRTLSDPLLSTFSYDCAPAAKSLARNVSYKTATNFGGRPQPLPPPASKSKIFEHVVKPVWLPLPAPQGSSLRRNASVSSSSELVFVSGGSPFLSTSLSKSSSVTSDGDEIGSWSIRRGKVAPMGGLPLPLPSVATKLLPGLESYEFSDLEDATQEFAAERCMEKGEFGAVYRAWVKDTATELKKELAVVRLIANYNQTLKDWKADVQLLAQLPDSNICLIKGYCTHEDTKAEKGKTLERLLVFEQSPNGNLHDYLSGSRSKTQLDWPARISIVLGAARGLLYLHDRAPLQIVYREFKASSVLLDKDHTPRLAGYGLTVTSLGAEKKSSFTTMVKLSQAYAKSNIWSFGIVLLELLTGKYSRDTVFLCDEKNFVQWATPFLKDESKLVLILDPRMKAKCPMKGALKLAELALRCLKKKVQRPNMSRVVDTLKFIKGNFGGRVENSSSNTFENRRATFGGTSLQDVDCRSKVVGQFLSMESTPCVTASSDDGSRFGCVAPSSNCGLQTGKCVERANSSRVF